MSTTTHNHEVAINQKYEFKAIEHLSWENSFGVIKRAKVELDCTIGINSFTYGWFEFYDVRTGGENWYAEGSLEIEDRKIVGYDGVFGLPVCITDKLQELGFDVEEVI
jgi:hypothetical protein